MGRLIGFLLYWAMVLLWRFFTGAHMNGKTYNDATWWQDASSMYRKRRMAYTWWRRKARMKRASWRHCIFWPVTFITFALVFYTSSAVIVLACLGPGLCYIGGMRIRRAWYLPIVAKNSDGSVRQHWVLKPKIRRRLTAIWHPKTERRRPGVAMRGELMPGTDETEVTELEEQPSTTLKLLLTPEDMEGLCTDSRHQSRRLYSRRESQPEAP